MLSSLLEVYRYRTLFHNMVARDLRARYKGSVLGFLWAFFNPLLMLLVYTVLFSVIMRLGMKNYALFLFTGLLPWMFTQTSIQRSAGIIVQNGNLIKKIYFPRELLPLSIVVSGAINYLLSLLILIAALYLYGLPLGWQIIFFPLVLAVQFIWTLAISLLTSALTVFFRDLEHILGIALMAWFYLTPVLYPLTQVGIKYQELFWINPMTSIIVSYQNMFFYRTLPPVKALGAVMLTSILVGYTSISIFNRLKRGFAEEL